MATQEKVHEVCRTFRYVNGTLKPKKLGLYTKSDRCRGPTVGRHPSFSGLAAGSSPSRPCSNQMNPPKLMYVSPLSRQAAAKGSRSSLQQTYPLSDGDPLSYLPPVINPEIQERKGISTTFSSFNPNNNRECASTELGFRSSPCFEQLLPARLTRPSVRHQRITPPTSILDCLSRSNSSDTIHVEHIY